MIWVIQNNLSRIGAEQLNSACTALSIPFLNIEVRPFDLEPPDLRLQGPIVFYGATNFINTIYQTNRWKPGVFFDAESFCMSAYLKHWKMLNSGAELTTLGEFGQRKLSSEELFFIRPDRDLKEFAGEVISFGDFTAWQSKISAGGYLLGPDCKILVSEPVGISNEWRLFIVDGKVITGSHYRSYFRLDVNPDVPDEVISFAEDMAKIWTPSPVFVMDVGKSGEGLYVIEANCFNSSGFYAADIKALVASITEYVKKTYVGSML